MKKILLNLSKYSVFGGILLFFAVLGCNGAEEDLTKKIQSALQDNTGISCEEKEDIINYIATDAEMQKKYGTSVSLDMLITKLGLEMSKKKRRPINPEFSICNREGKRPENLAPPDPGSMMINLFLENSASMNGYFRGNREFKDAMLNLLTRINGKNDRIGLNFVNSKVYPIPEPLEKFINLLTPEYASKTEFGNRSTSEINKILDLVALSAVQKPNDISIVVSDYIYSIKTSNVADELVDQKYATTLAIQRIAKKGGYSVLIVKFESSFDGKFYDCKNNEVTIQPSSGEKRPFYVWVVGRSENIDNFIKDYRITELKGFKNYVVFEKKVENPPFYTVLLQTGREGTFKAERTGEVFNRLTEIKLNQRKICRWSIALDLSNISVDSAYFNQPENYAVVSPNGGTFKVVEVQPIKNIVSNDTRYKGSSTHFIVVEGSEIPIGSSTVKVGLKQQVPGWVHSGSTIDDTDKSKRLNKTFGFLQLVEGVAEAYNLTEESTYFQVPIQLNR